MIAVGAPRSTALMENHSLSFFGMYLRLLNQALISHQENRIAYFIELRETGSRALSLRRAMGCRRGRGWVGDNDLPDRSTDRESTPTRSAKTGRTLQLMVDAVFW